MFFPGCICCTPPPCDLFDDAFASDNLATDYTQVSGTWAVTSGYLETTSSNALLKLNTGSDVPDSKLMLTVDIKAMTSGDVIRVGIGYDGTDYLYAEITRDGVCGIMSLNSTSGGKLSEDIWFGNSTSSDYAKVFVAYDGSWFYAGQWSGSTPAATTVHAVQVAAPSSGYYAVLGTGSIGGSGVRFDNIALASWYFTDTSITANDGCFTHSVRCGPPITTQNSGTPPTFTDDAASPPCPLVALSGSWPTLTSGNGHIRVPASGLLLYGHPQYFDDDEMGAAVYVYPTTAGTVINLHVGCDDTGAGGHKIEATFGTPSGLITLQMYDAAGSPIGPEIETVWGYSGLSAWTYLSLYYYNGYMVGRISGSGGGNFTSILVIDAPATGRYMAVESGAVPGNCAIGTPVIAVANESAQPTLRPSATCWDIATNCRECKSDGTTMESISVVIGALDPPTHALFNDGGNCAAIGGTYILANGDFFDDEPCTFRKLGYSWDYDSLCEGDVTPPIGGTVSSAVINITVTLTATTIAATITLSVTGTDCVNSPVTRTQALNYSKTLTSDPRTSCDQEFILNLTGSGASPQLCTNAPSTITVEFS